MNVVASPAVADLVRRRGGHLWVRLDPHRCMVGSYLYLEAATDPPGTTRATSFTRSSRRPHRFAAIDAGGFVLHYDWGRMDSPEELHLARRGWRRPRVEAYWNGCVFAGPDVPAPSTAR